MFCNNEVYVCTRWRCSRWWDCQTGFCGEDYCRFAWSAQAKLNQCCCFCSGRHLADYTAEPPPTQHTHTIQRRSQTTSDANASEGDNISSLKALWNNLQWIRPQGRKRMDKLNVSRVEWMRPTVPYWN